jgi:hypothetical protein
MFVPSLLEPDSERTVAEGLNNEDALEDTIGVRGGISVEVAVGKNLLSPVCISQMKYYRGKPRAYATMSVPQGGLFQLR